MSARIENTIEMSIAESTTPITEVGWYAYRSASGWGTGDPIPQDVTINKIWENTEGLEELPNIQLILLANGDPARHMDGSRVKPIVLDSNSNVAVFENVWKFGRDPEGVHREIEYSVVEKYILADGSIVDTHEHFGPSELVKQSNSEMTLVNISTVPTPEPTTATEPTTTAEPTTTTTAEPTTTTEPTTATEPTTTAEPTSSTEPEETTSVVTESNSTIETVQTSSYVEETTLSESSEVSDSSDTPVETSTSGEDVPATGAEESHLGMGILLITIGIMLSVGMLRIQKQEDM